MKNYINQLLENLKIKGMIQKLKETGDFWKTWKRRRKYTKT